jgi:hypothetical protein
LGFRCLQSRPGASSYDRFKDQRRARSSALLRATDCAPGAPKPNANMRLDLTYPAENKKRKQHHET